MLSMNSIAMPKNEEPISHLLNNNSPGRWYDSFGDDDGEDAVLQAGLDVLLLDSDWEFEAAAEGSGATFRDPVLGLFDWCFWCRRFRVGDCVGLCNFLGGAGDSLSVGFTRLADQLSIIFFFDRRSVV